MEGSLCRGTEGGEGRTNPVNTLVSQVRIWSSSKVGMEYVSNDRNILVI